MKKFNQIKKMLFTLSLWAFAGVVQALPTPVALGNVGVSGTVPLEVDLPLSGAFSDTFTFTLASGKSADISLFTAFAGDALLDLPAISFQLLGASGAGTYLPDLLADDVSLLAGFTFTGLTAGSLYTLIVSGDEAGLLGSSYSLQMAAHRLPEPATFALLLLSLGLMGLASRFQINKKAAHQ